jgi:hypothetical protein
LRAGAWAAMASSTTTHRANAPFVMAIPPAQPALNQGADLFGILDRRQRPYPPFYVPIKGRQGRKHEKS